MDDFVGTLMHSQIKKFKTVNFKLKYDEHDHAHNTAKDDDRAKDDDHNEANDGDQTKMSEAKKEEG